MAVDGWEETTLSEISSVITNFIVHSQHDGLKHLS